MSNQIVVISGIVLFVLCIIQCLVSSFIVIEKIFVAFIHHITGE